MATRLRLYKSLLHSNGNRTEMAVQDVDLSVAYRPANGNLALPILPSSDLIPRREGGRFRGSIDI